MMRTSTKGNTEAYIHQRTHYRQAWEEKGKAKHRLQHRFSPFRGSTGRKGNRERERSTTENKESGRVAQNTRRKTVGKGTRRSGGGEHTQNRHAHMCPRSCALLPCLCK